MLRNPALRRAADAYDRAAQARYGRIPGCTHAGDRLRLLARWLAALGPVAGTGYEGDLVASLATLTAAIADVRMAQQHAAQAAATRRAAEHLRSRLFCQTRATKQLDLPGRRVKATPGNAVR